MLAQLFSEEDSARDMARRLAQIAQTSKKAAAAERPSLLEFLRGPIERHFHYEEVFLFPKLEARGLGPEVGVATKQHNELRKMAVELEAAKTDDEVAQLVFDAARLMLHHTNFEGDYIYPELTHDDWRELLEETIQ